MTDHDTTTKPMDARHRCRRVIPCGGHRGFPVYRVGDAMSDLAHHHIAQKLNRRAQTERENQNMEEIERQAMPLMYAVFALAFFTVIWITTEDYRNVAQHQIDTASVQIENKILSEKMARCANKGIVPFNGSLLQCDRIDLVAGLQ